jgi:hypothetical protein
MKAQGNTIKIDSVKYWDFNGNFGITFNQISFINWAKGGENSISGTSFANLYANYKKSNWEWMNYFLVSYGLIRQGDSKSKFKKSDDRIELNSKLGYKQWQKFYWSFNANFKTQFAPGYNYPNDSVMISKAFAPAYLILGLGVDYQPTEHISISFSPLSGRFIYVNDTIFSKQYGLVEGTNLSSGFGWYFTAGYKHDSVMKNVGIATKLTLFQNYIVSNKLGPNDIVVDWQGQFLFKINTFLSAVLNLHMIYDPGIEIPIYETVNGEDVQVGTGPRVQLMEQFGLGIVYKF